MILIVGGTGSLGGSTARRLLARGKPVRIMTRTPEKAADLEKLGAEIVQGDLLDKASLGRACNGAEKVLASAHSILGRGKEASKFVDLQGHIDLIDASEKAGVKHFIYISVYNFGPKYESVPFMQYKRAVERYLLSTQLKSTIFQPTAFMESHAERFIGQSLLENGKVTLFGKGENPRNFVAADDVAQLVTLAIDDAEFIGQTIEIGGLDNLTNMEVIRSYESLIGTPAKVAHLPLGLLKIMYRVLRPLHPGLSQIMQTSIYSDTVDCTFDPTVLLATYPVKLTSFSDWIIQRDYQMPSVAGNTVQA